MMRFPLHFYRAKYIFDLAEFWTSSKIFPTNKSETVLSQVWSTGIGIIYKRFSRKRICHNSEGNRFLLEMDKSKMKSVLIRNA